MLFNSFAFLIFFPTVTAVYFLTPHRMRWAWLLSASVFFYMYFIPKYILILAITILTDYCLGIIIAREQNQVKKKWFLFFSILSNVGLLAVFKYADFGISNINLLAKALHWNYSLPLLNMLLPIGLSFHTFQSLSYVIEVYKGKQLAEKNLGIFALYVMFYPQLVAGPIERPQNLLHQFKEQHYFNYQKTVSGLKLMTLGFLKKTVIADRSAEFANLVYNNIHNYSGWQLIVATIFFAFQIYFDFSGYSDIARGAARIMGFELMINFKNPYNAQSITEFWQRWHISLSSWFKDYVYIPLGGSRVSSLKNMRNVMIVFLLSGLWHGASWTYVFWGGLNGLYLIIEKNIFSLLSQKIPPLISSARLLRVKIFFNKLIMFLFACFAWILFRANSLQDAGYIITHLFTGLDMFTQIINIGYVKQHILLGRGILNFSIAILFIFIIETAQRSAESAGQEPEDILNNRKWYFRWMVYYLILSSILLFGLFNQESFIYFQF